MAYDLITLSEERRNAGARILKITDDVGLDAVGAAWVWNRESDNWWFLLVTPLIDSKGPRWVYERLLATFSRVGLPEGVTPLEIRLASPRESAFHNFPIRVDFSASPGLNNVNHFQDMTIGGLHIDFMAIYRMMPESRHAGDVANRFALRVDRLLAA